MKGMYGEDRCCNGIAQHNTVIYKHTHAQIEKKNNQRRFRLIFFIMIIL